MNVTDHRTVATYANALNATAATLLAACSQLWASGIEPGTDGVSRNGSTLSITITPPGSDTTFRVTIEWCQHTGEPVCKVRPIRRTV